MNKVIVVLVSLLCSSVSISQSLSPIEVGRMNDLISEPSGIETLYNPITGSFDFWLHNDHGNEESIYSFRLDDLDSPLRIMDVSEPFVDWEDMTTDEDGNIYLGDFGNWVQPDEFKIIKIPDPRSYTGTPPEIERIAYNYPFDGVSDVEAMIHFNGYLYLFTKRVNAEWNPALNEDYSYCFRIPDASLGNGSKHIAELVSEYKVRLPSDVDSTRVRITGADISPDNKTLALLCYERVWVFSCFEGDDFFSGDVQSFDIPFRQYEGICFIDDHEVILSKEGDIDNVNNNPKLFYLNLAEGINEDCLNCDKLINGNFDKPDNAWSLFTYSNGTAEADLSTEGGLAQIEVTQLSTNQWHANMRHKSLVLEEGKTYALSFRAHALEPTQISVIVNSADGSNGYYWSVQALESTAMTFTHEFTMDQATDFNSYLSFNFGNSSLTKIYIDDVSLVEKECSRITSIPGSESNALHKAIQAFPNPSKDVLNLIASFNFDHMSLYDYNGQLIKDVYFQSIRREMSIDVSSLKSGIYFVKLEGNTTSGYSQIIKH